MRTHQITAQSGTVYEARKMRTEQSFYLPTYHIRPLGSTLRFEDTTADTLREVRDRLGESR